MGIELGGGVPPRTMWPTNREKRKHGLRAFAIIDHDIFENSKSYIGKFNSELWYFFRNFKSEMIFLNKVSLCQHFFTKIWSLSSKERRIQEV